MHLKMAEQVVDDDECLPVQIVPPFGGMLLGSVQAGKTWWLRKFLKSLPEIIKPGHHFARIIYCYKMYQSVYDEMKKEVPLIEFVQGFPKQIFDELSEDAEYETPVPTLILLDDLWDTLKNDPRLRDLYLTSRHLNVSVMLIIHNIYHQTQVLKDASKFMQFSRFIASIFVPFFSVRNTNIYVLFEMSSANIVKNLGRDIFSQSKDFLYDAWRQEMDLGRYNYLFVQLKVDVPKIMRVAGNIFSPYDTRCYLPLNER